MAEQDELIAAVVKDDTIRARAILDHDPHLLRMRTPNGTLVLTAVYHGANKALGLLLERTPEDALSLHEAAATGNARRLKTILGQSRTRVNAGSSEGFTRRGLAAFFGHLDAAKVLLEHGAAVNFKESSRFANTALDAAVAGEHPAVALEVLRPVDPAVRVVLRLREDRGPRALRPREMGVHAVHADAEAVDHPWDR